ncbi:hypothetical protein Tco_0084228 [Tanacetum coccineum]
MKTLSTLDQEPRGSDTTCKIQYLDSTRRILGTGYELSKTLAEDESLMAVFPSEPSGGAPHGDIDNMSDKLNGSDHVALEKNGMQKRRRASSSGACVLETINKVVLSSFVNASASKCDNKEGLSSTKAICSRTNFDNTPKDEGSVVEIVWLEDKAKESVKHSVLTDYTGRIQAITRITTTRDAISNDTQRRTINIENHTLQLSSTSAMHYYLNPNILMTYNTKHMDHQVANPIPALNVNNHRLEDPE